MNHEQRLRQVRIGKGPPPHQLPGTRQGLREEDEMGERSRRRIGALVTLMAERAGPLMRASVRGYP
jgi:hypothetical protein